MLLTIVRILSNWIRVNLNMDQNVNMGRSLRGNRIAINSPDSPACILDLEIQNACNFNARSSSSC